jgi:hypothetical protein
MLLLHWRWRQQVPPKAGTHLPSYTCRIPEDRKLDTVLKIPNLRKSIQYMMRTYAERKVNCSCCRSFIARGLCNGVDLHALCEQEPICIAWERVHTCRYICWGIWHVLKARYCDNKQMTFTCLYSFANRIQRETYWKGNVCRHRLTSTPRLEN